MQDLAVVPFEPSHLAGGLRLSQAAGWPHRADDWAAIAAVSEGVAVLDVGQVVGTGFCTVYGDRCRLNMIIVDERLRGRGFGRRLMEALVALMKARPAALIATPDGFPLYRKFGFEPAGDISQFQGIVTVPVPMPPGVGAARAGGPNDAEAVRSLDRAATGVDRAELFTHLLAEGRLFLGDGGYAILRDFGRGRVLGPLVARDRAGAQALMAAATRDLAGTFLRVDTDPALGLAPTLEAMGLTQVGGGTVMFAGPPPRPRGGTVFTLASQALG